MSLLTFTSSAQVVISEIHYHPVEEPVFNADGTPFLELTNNVHEFVEIQNTAAFAVDLSGWSLAGGISYTFPTNTAIAPGAFRVIAKNPARLATVYSLNVANVLGPYRSHLGNRSDTVRVRDAVGNTVDAVTYDSRFPWAQTADALGAADRFTGLSSANYQYQGRSLQRVSVSWPSNDPANWLASPITGPTPGAAQAVTRAIPKPVVIAQSAVQTSDGATLVLANNAVTVNCTYSATNSLSRVTLEYFVDDLDSTSEMRTRKTMTSLGNGRFAGTIPGQVDRSIVRYRFKADRGDGSEVVSPRSDDPQIAPVGAGGALEAWHGYFVTPVRTSTNAAIYDVFVSSASLVVMSNNITQSPKRATLANATGLPRAIPYVAASEPQWDGTVPGVFAYNGQVWDIRIRYHGSRYHRAASNHSYKLHFPDHQAFNDQSSWFETLHSTEFIEAQRINRLLGLPASKMRKVDWYLNNSNNQVHSEQGEYAGEMLDAYHALQQQLNPGSAKEESGELYKDVGNRSPTQNNLEGPYTRGDMAPLLANAGWTQLQRYDWNFALQNNAWKGATPIRDLIEGMWTARGDSPATTNFPSNTASLARARAWFTNNWDIETTVTSLALLEWMGIWDDAGQNQFFWRRANGQWSRLGWDYDFVMSTNSGGFGGRTNQTIYGGENGAPTVFDGVNWWKDTFYKCFRTEYNQRLWELNNSFFDPTNLKALGFTRAFAFANSRRDYVNAQLAALGTYHKPARPTNTYPPDAASVVVATNLMTSAYAHPQSAAHYATRWEIRSATGDYEEPVLRVTSTNHQSAYPIPFDQLTYGQTYLWRATHLDSNGHPSIVSAETSFTWGTSSTTAGTLVMNEILAFNRTAAPNGSTYPDYIELRNNSASTLTLTGYTLTDDSLNPAKYSLPAGTTIAAGAYLLIWCDYDLTAPGLHSGFGLDSDGQTVLLMNGSTIVDSVSFGPQAPDVSIGRIINGTGGWQANTPTPGAANSARTLGSVSNLRVNEWLANPSSGVDWFEIYNTGTNGVALSGLYLSDTPSTPMITQIPALSFIAGKGFTRFYADGSPSGGSHANFKLSNSGESIVLTDANGATTIDTVTFGIQTKDVSQGRLPDGGNTLVSFPTTPTPGSSNYLPLPGVVINEVLTHTDPPLLDAIEIYNPNSTNVAIGGWYLSNNGHDLKRFRVANGTIVPAGGFKVFYETEFNGGPGSVTPFTFNAAHGDAAWLSEADTNGNLTGYRAGVEFGAAEKGVAFGRFQTTVGVDFTAMSTRTFGVDNPASTAQFSTGTGRTNAYPKVGPVVINEIMCHPPDLVQGTNIVDDTTNEFIELHNVTGDAVPLFDPASPTNTWRLAHAVDFIFPRNVTMGAGEFLLVVSFDPTNTATLNAFKSRYGITNSTRIFGPYGGKLANNGETIELYKPDPVQQPPHPDAGFVPQILVDKVAYQDSAPWPAGAVDGGGWSLQRTGATAYGNDPANWIGAPATPGAINLGLHISTVSPLQVGVVGSTYTRTLAATGGTPPYAWSLVWGELPGGIDLGSPGELSGTPTNAGTFSFILQVADNASGIAQETFTAAIQNQPLTIAVQGYTGGTLQLFINGDTGPDYTIQGSTNLVDWATVFTTNAPSLPFTWIELGTNNFSARFYRVLIR